MKFCTLAVVAFSICGCSSRVPFAEAVPGTSYSVEKFEMAIISEKIAFKERQKRELTATVGEDRYLVYERRFPTWSQWKKMKRKVKAGDEIVEFHHRLYGAVFDGPAEADQHGYALVRNGTLEDYVSVDGVFPGDYDQE